MLSIDADETLTHIEKSTRTSGESLFLFSPPHGSAAPAPAASGVTDRRTERNQRPVTDLEASGVQQRLVSGDVVVLSEHKEALKLQELLFQDRLLQKDREIQVKDKEMDEVRTKLEATLEAQAQMRQIVGEYEKTISQLIAEKEREKASMEQTLQSTAKERDQAIEDLKEVERAFSEFHRMYERNRAAAEGLHKNEEALKKAMTAYQERLQQEQHKYETLKLHAAQKLEGSVNLVLSVHRFVTRNCNLEFSSEGVFIFICNDAVELLCNFSLDFLPEKFCQCQTALAGHELLAECRRDSFNYSITCS